MLFIVFWFRTRGTEWGREGPRMGWGGAHGESLLQSPVSLPIFVLLRARHVQLKRGGGTHSPLAAALPRVLSDTHAPT